LFVSNVLFLAPFAASVEVDQAAKRLPDCSGVAGFFCFRWFLVTLGGGGVGNPTAICAHRRISTNPLSLVILLFRWFLVVLGRDVGSKTWAGAGDPVVICPHRRILTNPLHLVILLL
jgi:hypothetical protein